MNGMVSIAAQPHLPPELIHEIILNTVSMYLDELMAGPLAITHVGGYPLEKHNPDIRKLRRKLNRRDDLALKSPNPVLSLLVASLMFRQTVLKILSEILEVALDQEGMMRCVFDITHASQADW